jgi:hypothetical protein
MRSLESSKTMKTRSDTSNGFYFALPRLLNRMRGGPDQISEACVVEAYFGSAGIFGVTYVLAWQLFAGRFAGWRTILTAALLVIAVWIFWLLIFYLNALVIKALRAGGLLQGTPNRDAQNILVGFILAALAFLLSILQDWTRWIGIFCLLGLGVNFFAMVMLAMVPKRS